MHNPGWESLAVDMCNQPRISQLELGRQVCCRGNLLCGLSQEPTCHAHQCPIMLSQQAKVTGLKAVASQGFPAPPQGIKVKKPQAACFASGSGIVVICFVPHPSPLQSHTLLTLQ